MPSHVLPTVHAARDRCRPWHIGNQRRPSIILRSTVFPKSGFNPPESRAQWRGVLTLEQAVSCTTIGIGIQPKRSHTHACADQTYLYRLWHSLPVIGSAIRDSVAHAGALHADLERTMRNRGCP